MSELRFSINRTRLEGKQGKLPMDSNGYYRMLVGAYNLENSVGQVYGFTKRVENLFLKSTMIRRMNDDALFGESGHPPLSDFQIPGRSKEIAQAMWIDRLYIIDPAKIACALKNIHWVEMPDKVNGRTVYGVYADIKPLVEPMRISLDTPEINTYMSLRASAKYIFSHEMGEMILENDDLSTYDWVGNGGIRIACKHETPVLESERLRAQILEEDSCMAGFETFRSLAEFEESQRESRASNENDNFLVSTIIKENGNWIEVPDVSHLATRRW